MLQESNICEFLYEPRPSSSPLPVQRCPESGFDPCGIRPDDFTSIAVSKSKELCTLTLIEYADTGETLSVAPVARSYEGNQWEGVKGPFEVTFVCNDAACSTTLPSIPSPHYAFSLNTFSADNLNIGLEEQAARFLEQTTFGPTLDSIADLTSGASDEESLEINFIDWVFEQMYITSPTYHREYYRKRAYTASPRIELAGNPQHVCSPKTVWHSYAFIGDDALKYIEVSRTSDDSRYILSMNGIPRTEVDNVDLVNIEESLEVGKSYQICSIPRFPYESIGARLFVKVEGRCRVLKGGNPQIQFSSSNPVKPPATYEVSPDLLDDFIPIPGFEDTFVNENGLKFPMCSVTDSIGEYPIYLDFGDFYYAFFPRIELLENTLENIAPDGGGAQTRHGALCSNAARSFLNEDTCVMSTEIETCSSSFDSLNDYNLSLDTESLTHLFSSTNYYLYAIAGLWPYRSPCMSLERSRWELSPMSQCEISQALDVETKDTLVNLLRRSNDSPLRDALMEASNSATCDIATTTPSDDVTIAIQLDSECWKLVHPDHHSVHDMSSWVNRHPGGPDKITQFALNGETFLEFPSWHPISRWENEKETFPLLGRYGETVLFRDLPSYLQKPSAEAFGIEMNNIAGIGVMICGSPGEVSNDAILGEEEYIMNFDTSDNGAQTFYYKSSMWTNIALKAPDQLRQRMAWALSQLLVINIDDLNTPEKTEGYVNYYDNFVRNAFGSYRDILKEVAYSPPMSGMLTFYNSKSTSYNWENLQIVTAADENFAREIMQLFTIGTVMLNMDGSMKIDPTTSEPIASYTNEHIRSFARAWTGFTPQNPRGNIEMPFNSTFNSIDPLKIMPEWRDMFPKINLSGGFIGDGYPLCVDMPEKMFLRKGAKYRLLGSSTNLELQSNPSPNIDARTTGVFLSNDSKLHEKLCTIDEGGSCQWPNSVILNENIPCHGQECEVETLRLVQVAENVFYEYVSPPCVRFPYYHNPKKVSRKDDSEVMCADPRSITASEACCTSGSSFVNERNCVYVGERMSYNKAVDRCQEIGLKTCDFQEFNGCTSDCCSWIENYFWHKSKCTLKVIVLDSGYISIIHLPYDTNGADVWAPVFGQSISSFPVYWEDDFPSISNQCGQGACRVLDESCLCSIEVVETSVFQSMPNDVDEVLSNLHIGSFDPHTFDSQDYESPIINGGIKVYLNNNEFNKNTIVEVEVKNEMKYYKNMNSFVKVISQNGASTSYSFRNPPHFMNMIEPTARDAHHETDAVLDDYFYHPNTAPFLATYFIQRFGISNPSPRYVSTVAEAFTSGSYDFWSGSQQYGDLGAMLAAIILDREARSTVMSLDPSTGSLREPLLKFIGYMRAMEFETFEGLTVVRDAKEKIGQMVFEQDSIFSFFSQDFVSQGPIQDASLVDPEGKVYMTSTVIGLLNGLFSLTKWGFSSCVGGLGPISRCNELIEGITNTAYGELTYSPLDSMDAEDVVNELALLLTAGRLSQESKNIIADEYNHAENKESGLRLAQQLIVTSPEFHSTNYAEFTGEERKITQDNDSPLEPYKGFVHLFLNGGVDSYNILVPHSGCTDKDMYEEYNAIRNIIALPKSVLLTIGTGEVDQVCDTFGIHPDLPILQSLYESGEAVFFANAGQLPEPVTKANYLQKTGGGLFAHNKQEKDVLEVDPHEEYKGTGVLGRMADALTEHHYNVGSHSLVSYITPLLKGQTSTPFITTPTLEEFNQLPSNSKTTMLDPIKELNKVHNLERSGLFGNTWSDILDQAFKQTLVYPELASDEAGKYQAKPKSLFDVDFPSTNLGRNFEEVANIINGHEDDHDDRQFIEIQDKGYDTHDTVSETLSDRFVRLNDALSSFVSAMKEIGKWDDTIILLSSEFGRTISPNSRLGSDHGWGGNYVLLGGGVKGGRILGKYPDDLSGFGPQILDRGRIIPTLSWDAILNGIAEWMGIEDEEDLDLVLPNRVSFGSDLFRKEDLFH